jgi:hypothetical protein
LLAWKNQKSVALATEILRDILLLKALAFAKLGAV